MSFESDLLARTLWPEIKSPDVFQRSRQDISPGLTDSTPVCAEQLRNVDKKMDNINANLVTFCITPLFTFPLKI